jgi:hypothetical protein
MGLSAERLLKSLGVEKPDDIDLEAIAYDRGALVRYSPLDGCEARIVGRGDRAIITVNSRSEPERQRFSIGHELGHWGNDRGRVGFLCDKEVITVRYARRTDPESLANAFAAELLMPGYLFKPLVARRPVTFDVAEEMAEAFNVSRTAAAIRLVDLGSFPAMVVCHGPGGRLWFHASPLVPASFFPHSELHQETDAFDILFGRKSRKSRAGKVQASCWIDRPDASKYELIEQTIRVLDTVLTLLWWKDESQIIDYEDRGWSST